MPTSNLGPESLEPSSRDAQAVTEVLQGERLAYRGLVERHHKLVYAVAWSRLGDATLAEDAAQEAFIRAYRSLPLLGNGAKFAAWITAIARNTAISLGLKERRELAKRTRWALEQPVAEPPAAPNDEACSPEILRQALAELPDDYRECLVLYYLEGRQGAEAATALAITEGALRMRLMRARAALREKLEARLGESLVRLEPAPSFVPVVMGAIMSSSAAKTGAGLGGTAGAVLGKILPLKLAVIFVPWLALSSGLHWWMLRTQRLNLRDQQGFRAQAYRQTTALQIIGANAKVLLLFLALLAAFLGFSRLIGIQTVCWLLVPVWLVCLANRVRLARINRRKFFLINSSLIMLNGLNLAWALGWGASSAWDVPLVLLMLLLQVLGGEAARPPPRLDYNLFLRAQLGLLGVSEPPLPSPALARPLSRDQLLAFARFLGERFLVFDYRWERPDVLALQTAPVSLALWFRVASVLHPRLAWKNCSWIALHPAGSVSAHGGASPMPAPMISSAPAALDRGESEQRVAAAIHSAWQLFRAGNLTAAERALGHLPESEIFLASPPRLTFRRVGKFVLIGMAGFAAVIVLGAIVGVVRAMVFD